MNFNSLERLGSAKLTDQAFRDAIEQWHFGHLVHDNHFTELKSA